MILELMGYLSIESVGVFVKIALGIGQYHWFRFLAMVFFYVGIVSFQWLVKQDKIKLD